MKNEERFNLEFDEIQWVISTDFDNTSLVEKELQILKMLNWSLNKPTTSEIAKLLLLSSSPGYNFDEIFNRLEEIIVFCLLDELSIHVDSCTLAIASLIVVL